MALFSFDTTQSPSKVDASMEQQSAVDQNYFHPRHNFPSLRKPKYSLINKFSETLLAQAQWENLTMNILFIIYLFALSFFATYLTGIFFISGVR